MTNTFSNSFMAAKAESKKLSDGEFSILLESAKKGDVNARNKILMDNMGLIVKIAIKVFGKNCDCLEDHINDGCVRFLELINDYDPKKACLSTYVWNPILQYMNKGVPESNPLIGRFKYSYDKAVCYLHNLYKREPSVEEIADFMGMSVSLVTKRLCQIAQRNTVSLDVKISQEEDNSSTLKDKIECSDEFDPSIQVMAECENEGIRCAFERLSDAEKKILSIRYNKDGSSISLRQAAEKTGLSTETIRQRENKVKKHLKTVLEDYGVMAA